MDKNEHPCTCQLCQPTMAVAEHGADVSVEFHDADRPRPEDLVVSRPALKRNGATLEFAARN